MYFSEGSFQFEVKYRQLVEAHFPENHILYNTNSPYIFIQRLTHLSEHDHAQYRSIINKQERTNRKWRMLYMKNKINTEYYKRMIHQTDQRVEKSREYANVLDVFIQTSLDIFYRVIQHYQETKQMKVEILKEMTGMVEYVNECFKEISQTYRCVWMEISPRMVFEKKVEEQSQEEEPSE